MTAGIEWLSSSPWLVFSLTAPFLWGLVNIIDVYFVRGVYRDELDGTIISGLFQMVPWIAIFFLFDFDPTPMWGTDTAWLGIDQALWYNVAGGVSFTVAYYFYFKALFNHSDAALLQIMWSLTVLVVPLLTFLWWGETLPLLKYAGIGIVFAGAIAFSLQSTLRLRTAGRYVAIMLGAVLAMASGMVLEDRGYALLALRGLDGWEGFLVGFLGFSLGAAGGAAFFALASRRNPWPMIRQYAAVFLLIEGLSFLGTVASQRAISLAPSVSYVAAIETLGPIFITALSAMLLLAAGAATRRNAAFIQQMCRDQLQGWPVKTVAALAIAAGVYIISS